MQAGVPIDRWQEVLRNRLIVGCSIKPRPVWECFDEWRTFDGMKRRQKPARSKAALKRQATSRPAGSATGQSGHR